MSMHIVTSPSGLGATTSGETQLVGPSCTVAKCDTITLNDVIHAVPKLQRELLDVFSLSTVTQLPLFVTSWRCVSRWRLSPRTDSCSESYGEVGKQTTARMLSFTVIFGKNSAMEPGSLHRKNTRHY